MAELRLAVREFESPRRWRWVLTGPGGRFLADHEVRLDAGCWQFEAFTDLLGYLRLYAVPDRRIEDEARMVTEVGEWIGSQVLGPVGAAVVRARPATVRVVVPAEPEEARSLLFRPLELAHVAGRPLAVQGVTLVMQPGEDDDTGDVTPVGDRLRVLGLFSLPVGGQALNLRRERHALVRLLSGIAAVDRAVDVRVLQYGVTRARLREVLEEDEGWDIIHVSGHGAPGELLLETADGSPDPVTAMELAEMLDLARERVKLVSVSACWSAALTAADARRLLGLPAPGSSREAQSVEPERGRTDGAAAGSLATGLSGRLGCAVLAMRYPVMDDFAIALAGKLYDLLAAKNRPLPRALGIALSEVLPDTPTPARPALSAATPALFGARAVDLRLAAPERSGPQSYNLGELKMAGFPPQPDRFVGRTAVMARASAALAGGSGLPGMLLHGMPGGGKTACALELAYTHEHAFDRLVWFKAPDEGRDITLALTEFALTLERGLPGFQMVHVLDDPARLAAFLPQLTEICEQRRALIVVDNVESLLTGGGQWRDDGWGQVIAAMCGDAGLGRVVLTSRRVPAGLDGRVRMLTVDALSLDEALLLARELPHLRALIDGDVPGVKAGLAQDLAVGVLNVAQGHPKLLELADGQAADPAALGELVEAGDQAWQQAGGVPEGFFTTGEPQAADEDYLHVLGAWTRAVTADLAPGYRELFFFLCCLEEWDRIRSVVELIWTRRPACLGRAGQLSHPHLGLAALAAQGLVMIPPGTDMFEPYGIHPGVAAAGRALAGDSFQEAVDAELAALLPGMALWARQQEGEQKTGGLVVRAGLSAVPYLLRVGKWATAGDQLAQVLGRDRSRATAR